MKNRHGEMKNKGSRVASLATELFKIDAILYPLHTSKTKTLTLLHVNGQQHSKLFLIPKNVTTSYVLFLCM